jgi:hypothetical protein
VHKDEAALVSQFDIKTFPSLVVLVPDSDAAADAPLPGMSPLGPSSVV